MSHAEERLLDFGFKTVRGRSAKYIVERLAGKGSHNVEFPETRSDLGKMPGTSPEVLCRVLAEFWKKGWIAVSGKNAAILRIKQGCLKRAEYRLGDKRL